jgi:Rrf2 family iron-sulfur cluster assembly transcriptional regulator
MLIRKDRAMLAITILLDVAFHGGRQSTVSAADLAERLGLARRGMEPLLQALSRAGLLESVRGPRGGYRLGRPRRDIKLSEIVVVAGGEEPDAVDGPRGALLEKVVEPLWLRLEMSTQGVLAGMTLDDLLRQAGAAGLQRPDAEPITFAI